MVTNALFPRVLFSVQCISLLFVSKLTVTAIVLARPLVVKYGRDQSINQSINQFNSRLAARGPNSK